MKVAITGAAGYVGSLLMRAHVERGDAVHALARDAERIPALRGVARYGADLLHPGAIADAFFEHADVVYHCAAEIAHEPLMKAVNVGATRALLQRARGTVAHWVQVSSLSVYGTPRAGVITEESPLRPASPYAQSKCEADTLVASLSEDAFSYTIVRPSGVIGPHMRNRSIYGLIGAVDRGRFCFIGAPGAIGNFVHEQNVIDALLRCATRPQARGRTYNVAQNCSIEHMVNAIAAALGRTPPHVRIPEPLARMAAQIGSFMPGFPLTRSRVRALTSRVEYPTGRIEHELGFRHGKSITDALSELARLWTASTR